jgi:amidase
MDFAAFLPGGRLTKEPSASGPLDGLTFAVKDLFDVEGSVTGCGNPDWAASHPPAARDAWSVRRLLESGARLVGKTVTDEISLGLLGSNKFFGTPVNPIAQDRYPGGSSSGSAVAVASDEVDFALGSDTGGSVRAPASFLGLYGLRPTHGAIPTDGLMTQAPSFDTVGFFAREAEVFARVGDALLPEGPIVSLDAILVATDALDRCDLEIRQAAEPVIARLTDRFTETRPVVLAVEGLPRWNAEHCRLQHPEFSETFQPWLDAVNPRLSFGVARALALARLVPTAEREAAKVFRVEVRARVDALLAGRAVLCFATMPILPPLRSASLVEMARSDGRIVDLTCIAGLSGLPQVSLPLAHLDGLPIGISLVGPRNSDRALLELARRLANLQP